MHQVEIRSIGQVFIEAFEELVMGVPSVTMPWWRLFNDFTGGFRDKEFSILCGSTGAGKTTFLANVSAQLYEQRIKHLVLSVETGPHDFTRRVISAVHGKDYTRGSAVGENAVREVMSTEEKRIIDKHCYLGMYENRLDLDFLIKNIEYAVYELGCQIVILDNLNFFMEVVTNANANIEMDRVVHELIMLCKRTPVHIIMVMHPRKTQDGTRVLSEFDIKGSSTAVQEAQNVFLFNRMTKEEIEETPEARWWREIKIAKMRRRGEHVGKTLIFESRQTKYFERSFRDYN